MRYCGEEMSPGMDFIFSIYLMSMAPFTDSQTSCVFVSESMQQAISVGRRTLLSFSWMK